MPARLSTSARDEPPSPAVGPSGPFARSRSWQTVGSTMGELVVAAFALAGTATASAAVTAAAAIRGFLGDSIFRLLVGDRMHSTVASRECSGRRPPGRSRPVLRADGG